MEAANGLIKTWKALDKVFPKSQIPCIGDYVRIIAAICNAFRSPRVSSDPDDHIIAERMLRLSKKSNLQQIVEQEGWSRKNSLAPIRSKLNTRFP